MIDSSRKESAKDDGKNHKNKNIKLSLDQNYLDGQKQLDIKADASKGGDVTLKGKIADVIWDKDKTYLDFGDFAGSIKDDKTLKKMFTKAGFDSGLISVPDVIKSINDKLDDTKFSKLDGVNKNAAYLTASALRYVLEDNEKSEVKTALISALEKVGKNSKGVKVSDDDISLDKKELEEAVDLVSSKIAVDEVDDKYNVIDSLSTELKKIEENFEITADVENGKNSAVLTIELEDISIHPDYDSDITIISTKYTETSVKKVKIPSDAKPITKDIAKMIGGYINYKYAKNSSSAKSDCLVDKGDYDDDYDDDDYDDDDYDYDDDDYDYDDDDYDDDDYDDCDGDDYDDDEDYSSASVDPYYDRNAD